MLVVVSQHFGETFLLHSKCLFLVSVILLSIGSGSSVFI